MDKIKFVSRGKGGKTFLGKLFYLFYADIIILYQAIRFKPDGFVSFASIYAAHASSVLRRPHITFTDKNYRAFGGHLFDCRIAAAGEFIITKGEQQLTRKYNEDVGLFLWDCEI